MILEMTLPDTIIESVQTLLAMCERKPVNCETLRFTAGVHLKWVFEGSNIIALYFPHDGRTENESCLVVYDYPPWSEDCDKQEIAFFYGADADYLAFN